MSSTPKFIPAGWIVKPDRPVPEWIVLPNYFEKWEEAVKCANVLWKELGIIPTITRTDSSNAR